MPDLTDQLRDYHDALVATVEPVTAAEAMTTAAPPSPEARDRRARWQWRIVTAAAAVLVVVVGSVAVLGSRGPMRWLTDDGADALRGRTFQALSMTEGGKEPEPATGSLTFNGDTIDVYDGCNSGGGPFAIEQGRLVAASVVMTGGACSHPDSPSERWTRVIASAAFALDGDRLTLSDDTITVEFVDKDSSPPPGTVVASSTTIVSSAHTPTLAELDGRSFRSASVLEDGLEKALVPNPYKLDGSTAHLSLRVRDEVLVLEAGCNEMRTTPTIADGRIHVAANHTTQVDCGDALLAQDAWYYAFLEGSPEITVSGSTLTLTSGTTVIEFTEEVRAGKTPATTTPSTTASSPTSSAPTTIDTTTTSTVLAPGNSPLPPLVGTTWELVRIDRDPTATGRLDPAIVLPIDVAQTGQAAPTLLFVTEATNEMAGTIGGFNGCYRLTGGYSRTGTTLRPSTVSLPLDSCVPAAKATALAFDAALEDQQPPYTFTIDASGLRLESDTWTLQFRST